jgi:hypothetical protein
VSDIPNLFLIGAPKCGTTALAINLAQHQDIFLPKQKEPRYFDRSTFYDFEDDYITKTLNEYLSFYNTSEAIESKYKMDASVFNMYSQQSIDDILKLSPDAKFIVILRDPVDASLSMHRQRLTYVDKTMREVSEDFNECWNLLEKRKEGKGYPKGCRNKFLFRYDLLYSYENYLPYLKEKLQDKLFIGFYEDYKNKPDEFFKKLFLFLDIEPIKIENKKINESLVVKNSMILNIIEVILKYTFGIRKLLGLTGLKNLKKKLLSLYQMDKKDSEVDQRVYEYFKSTYKYIDRLKKESK